MRRYLFVSQRIDRVEVGGFEGGVGSEHDSDDGANHQSDNDPIHRDDGRQFQHQGEDVSAGDAEADSHDSADLAQHDGFHDELRHDVAFFGADGTADADFARSFGDGHEHDVHDAD